MKFVDLIGKEIEGLERKPTTLILNTELWRRLLIELDQRPSEMKEVHGLKVILLDISYGGSVTWALGYEYRKEDVK